jgi:fimbrial chaperone protein
MTRFLYIKLFFFLACITPYLAFANYDVSPVRVYFGAKDKIASINLKNGNDEDASFQLGLYKWTRVNGEDVYEESKDLTITPLIFKVKAGESQLIRVASKTTPKAGSEKAYRLFLKELPTRQSTEANAVNVVMQFGVPIFVEPSNKEGSLACNLNTQSKTLDLTCKNNHNQHTLVSALELISNEDSIKKHEINKYVFPGETMKVSLEKPDTDEKISGNLISYFKGSKIESPLTIN